MVPLRFRILLLVLAAACVAPGCDLFSKDDGVAADRMETAVATSNAAGVTTVRVADYDVNIATKTGAGTAVEGLALKASLTKRYLVVIADDPDGDYYPDIKILDVEDTREVSGDKIDVNMSVVPVGLLVHKYPAPPAHIEDLMGEEGIAPKTATGKLADVLAEMAVVAEDAGGLGRIIHFEQKVTQATGWQDPVTVAASAKIATVSFEAVVALVGDAVGIFDEDELTVTWGEDKQGKGATPFYVTDIEVVRSFQARVTLTWGANPSDLDSHLWTPAIQGAPYHVYFSTRGSQAAPPFADLDVDDTSSFGPENIVIAQTSPGTYRYAVHHYSGSGTLATSGAHVKLIPRTGPPREFDVPTTGTGGWWHVFDLDGATGAVTVVNQIVGSVPAPRGAEGGVFVVAPKR